MSKPFGNTLRRLLDRYPEDWLRLIRAEANGPIEVLDTKLTHTLEADKIFRAARPRPHLYHLEFQASYDRTLPDRVFVYNALTHQQHQLPLRSIVLLLRPQADGPEMTARVVRKDVRGDPYLDFRYDVIRVWQLPWRDVASAGVGALPLAAITDDAEHESKEVIREINRRMRHDVPAGEIGTLWTATYLLLGLRYSEPRKHEIWRGVPQMLDDVLR